MINIRQSQTNTVSISSLESLVTIPNPFYIFKWVDSYNYTFIKSFLDQSAYPERYSEFIVTDGSDLTFKASGHCYIYESPVDASAIDPSTMNLLTSEQYTFIPIAIADYVYEPSLYTYNAVDTVFDPQFNTNTPSPTYILHDDLSGRTNPDNHPQYIKEASLGSDFVWNSGVLDVSADGGGTDASVSELYDFYKDLSTYAHTQDASISNLYSTKQDNIADGTFVKEASLGTDLVWINGLLDVSINAVDTSVAELYEFYEDLSTYAHTQDASISDLYSKKADKTEIYSKTYIDGSLNAKQPAGTYLGPNDAFTSAYNESGDAKIFNSIALPNLSARSINASEGIQVLETANEIYIGVNSTIARTFQLSGLASETYVQQSLYPYATNASIGSAGFAKQDYVDASLNAKQDLIPDGTYLKEASLGTGLVWNGGQLDVSVEGGSSTQDTSIVDLYNYVEDLSTLVHDETQDPSIVDLYETAIFGTASSGTGEILLNVTQLPGELAAIKCSTLTAGTGVTFDISYGGVFGTDVDNITINASVGAIGKDPSIDDLYAVKADKTYVDASLNAKQDIISDGTFLKEVSIGTGFNWNAGKLDVSVEGGGTDFLPFYSVPPRGSDLVTYESSLNKLNQESSWYLKINNSSDNFLFSSGSSKGFYMISNGGSRISLINQAGQYVSETQSRSLYVNSDTYVDASFYKRDYIDGSLNSKLNKTLFDTSIASLTNWNVSQDASIGLLNTDISNIEASLGVLNSWNVSQDASIGLLNTDISNIESSIGDTTDITGLFLRETSLGTDFYFESGVLEVSIGIGDYATKTYVDGSLNLKLDITDASTTYLRINDASSNFAKRLTSITAFNTAYTVNPSDNLNVIQCDASMVVTFPNTLETGFQTTVVNASTGWVTLEASTLLTTDASVRLKNQYAGATVIHKGSGVFFAFGNLQ